MKSELEASRSRPPVAQGRLPGLILVAVRRARHSIFVIGLVVAVFWTVVVVAAIVAVLWAVNTLL